MPTKLETIGVASPGWKGLNLRGQGGFLDPNWATVATNLTFDEQGRLAARKGWTALSSDDAGSEVKQIYEYISAAGVGTPILATDTKMYSYASGSLTDITHATPHDDGNYKFQNWNDGANILTLGLNNSSTNSKYIQWTGSGAVTSVTLTGASVAPDGDDLMVSWGRVWGTHNNNTVIKYSVVLDHTDWVNTGSGTIDMYNVFGEGMDTITAIVPFNGNLVVFGKNNIVIYGDIADGAGKFLDPTLSTFRMLDHLVGVGCVARDSVQNIGTDLMFLDVSGIRSLGRVIQEKSAPLTEETINVRDHLALDIHSQSTMENIRSTYNQEEGFYLLSLPDLATPEVYVLDMRGKLEDGSRRVTLWQGWNPTAMFSSRLKDKILYTAHVSGTDDLLATYSGTTDNGSSIAVEYQTGWLSLTPDERLMIPKKIAGIFQVTGTHQISYKWAFDFNDAFKTGTKTITGQQGAQYGVAQYAVDSYTGGGNTQRAKVNMRGFGEHIKYGFSTVTSNVFSTSKLEIHTKLGRINP